MADIITERGLPHALDAERCVLGAIILENDSLLIVQKFLGASDFYAECNRIIFVACTDLIIGGLGVDLVTLRHHLMRTGDLEAVGGMDYVSKLIDEVPTANNIEHYAKLVQEAATERRAIMAFYGGIDAIYRRDTYIDTVVTEVEEKLRGLSTQSISDCDDVIIKADRFISLDMPEREAVVDSVFNLGSLNSIWSWRGLGKTQLLTSLAVSVATGTQWLHWRVPQPRHVLIVDGELPGGYLQWVVRNWLNGQDGSLISILASDIFYEKHGRQMDLMKSDDQKLLLSFIDSEENKGRKPEVIILDNLSCLFWGLDDEQDAFLKFLFSLRHRNICVIPADHGGKNREVRGARGASRKEDPSDVVIKLDEPAVGSVHGSAKFAFEFTKVRAKWPKPSRFECEMVPSLSEPGRWIWSIASPVDGDMKLQILSYMARNTVSLQAEIAEAVGLKPANLSKYLKKFRADGLVSELSITAKGVEFLDSSGIAIE